MEVNEKPELLQSLMLKLNLNYSAVKHEHLVFTEFILEYFPTAVAAEIGIIFERFPSKGSLDQIWLPVHATLFVMELIQSIIYPIPVEPYNESTLDSARKVIKAIEATCGVMAEKVLNRCFDSSDYQLTNALIQV